MNQGAESGTDQAADYEIRLRGHLDPRWTEAFPGLVLENLLDPDGSPVTVLRGPVPDEAALHGLLTRVRDLGVPLVSLARHAVAPPGT